MPTAIQSIREIVTTQPSAAKVFQRFDIDLCLQAEKSLDGACAELQLSVDQVLEKLADAETQERGGPPVDPGSLPIGKLIQHIVRVHHQYVRQELPRLTEMAQKLAAKRSDLAPEVKNVEELSFTTIRQRLISILLKLAQSEGRKPARGIEFQLPATYQELANQLGTVRELISRNLMRLQAEGLLDVDARQIVVKDVKGLNALLDTAS